MILVDIAPKSELRAHTCGYTPKLIEARGRVTVDPRLLGMPARQFHVECSQCGVATMPVYSRVTAEALWTLAKADAHLHAVSQLPALRRRTKRALLNLAA